MEDFFSNSGLLDYLVLRPLSHIELNWELTWDEAENKYIEEDGFSRPLNNLIKEIVSSDVPEKYHNNEDILAEYVIKKMKWPIKKVGNRWVGDDYKSILEQGGFSDINETNLVKAAAGRIHAAIRCGQKNFDSMEDSHQRILATVMSIMLYHRSFYIENYTSYND
ncbi:MAG: hypothetical protein HYX39_09935 [Bacteroidetes bacterium]|nr:hypothetical protein [Bacteroidota bacterium]